MTQQNKPEAPKPTTAAPSDNPYAKLERQPGESPADWVMRLQREADEVIKTAREAYVAENVIPSLKKLVEAVEAGTGERLRRLRVSYTLDAKTGEGLFDKVIVDTRRLTLQEKAEQEKAKS